MKAALASCITLLCLGLFIFIGWTTSLFGDFRGDPEFGAIDTFQDTLTPRAEFPSSEWPTLDGEYNMVYTTPWRTSSIYISSSTKDHLDFNIGVTGFAHEGGYNGTAYRIASSSIVYVMDDTAQEPDENLCKVTIEFVDMTHVKYFTEDISASKTYVGENVTCTSSLGFRAIYMDGYIHEKDFKPQFPTIKPFGFTDADIAQFDDMLANDSFEFAQQYIDEQEDLVWTKKYADEYPTIADGPHHTVRRLRAIGIQNGLAFSIESRDPTNGFPCDFNSEELGGYCTFVVFAKDDASHYWIMGGNASDLREGFDGSSPKGFQYATTDPKWKNKLPDVFKRELERLGVSESLVRFNK